MSEEPKLRAAWCVKEATLSLLWTSRGCAVALEDSVPQVANMIDRTRWRMLGLICLFTFFITCKPVSE
jgi:hypothetical protein